MMMAAGACSSSTGPDGGGGGGGTSQKTHPAGTVGERIQFGSRVDGIAISSAGIAYVPLIDESSVARFAVATPTTPLAPIATGPGPRSIVLDRAGTMAYVSTDAAKVYALDLAAGALKTTLAAPGTTSFASPYLALSSDGSRVYVGDESARVWSLPTSGAAPTSGQVAGKPWAIALAQSGGALYVANYNGGIWRLDPATLAVRATSTNSPILGWGIVVSPDNAEVYVASSNAWLFVLDATTLAERAVVELESVGGSMAMTPDGAQLWVASSGQVVIVDRVSRKVVSRVDLGGSPMQVAFDETGKTAFVTNLGGWVDIVR